MHRPTIYSHKHTYKQTQAYKTIICLRIYTLKLTYIHTYTHVHQFINMHIHILIIRIICIYEYTQNIQNLFASVPYDNALKI